MLTTAFILRVSITAMLILNTHGFPVKGSQSQGQSSSGSYHGGDVAPEQGAATGYYAPTYSASSDIPRLGPLVRPAPGSSLLVQGAPAPGSMSPTSEAGYGAGFVPAQDGYPGGPGLLVPVQVGYPVGPAVPLPAGYDAGSAQTGHLQPSLPETKWTVNPNIFSEEGLANTQALDSSSFVSPPSHPYGPVLQSGETSSVVKEAELGNYQHETEEIGYPAGGMGPGQGFASNPMSYGGGGYWGSPYPYPALYPLPYPYPNFDYRLLYGLYPPGTYTTFSKNHEKGKDYYQSIHYLEEHDSDADVPSDAGFGHQQKLVPRAPQSS